MPARAVEVVGVLALAAIVTATIAAPVLRAPSERVFGMEIVGRHHDPFSAMAAFARPIAGGIYSQPVTDLTGAFFARRFGPVAAYNWLILISFPLSAAAAYLLARHLDLSPGGATVAAMAFAFSPFHVAHAAYHPHIAQTQWVPLYLLALWRALDGASPIAIGFLAIATAGVTLSNFYGGLIVASITPVAVGAYWFTRRRTTPNAARHLMVTFGALFLFAVAGLAYVQGTAPGVLADPAAFAFPPGDVYRYSAKWWGYLVPPVAHPLLGGLAQRIWMAADVRVGLLEQQVSLGWGVMALGMFATYRWITLDRRGPGLAAVPVLVAVAVAALVYSLSPERTIGGFRFVRPSALLNDLVPMFRAYARFGVVVQLMAALLAGVGVECLRRTVGRPAQLAALALVVLGASEYAVSPIASWRDALPTDAHRWAMQQTGRVHVLDCMPLNQETESIQWLTGYRVTMLGGSISDCTEPGLSGKLAASGYTHLLVRRATKDWQWFAEHPAPDGLHAADRFDTGQLFAVTARTPAIYTATMTGFFPREHDAEWTWRWMGTDAAWTIVNTSSEPIVTSLDIDLSAFHRERLVELRLDGHPVRTLAIEPSRRTYHVGPLIVKHGGHELVFHPLDAPTRAGDAIGNGDGRLLSLAVGAWRWDAPTLSGRAER